MGAAEVDVDVHGGDAAMLADAAAERLHVLISVPSMPNTGYFKTGMLRCV